MVKSNAPLQIRLTEPVIFLRGPSTGTDFRGRPQAARGDGQPAMVRGLLTLRLTKPTRIRSIAIVLEGRSRTEWPEGIGPRRTDTFEEHSIISESATFFSAAASRSRSSRRAQSLGPGVLTQYDLDDNEGDDDLSVLEDAVDDDFGERGRPPRSASALPGTHDGSHWHRDGFSRRSSFGRSDALSRADNTLGMGNLNLRDRGPSPAYTPSVSAHPSRPSSLRESTTVLSTTTYPPRDHILSPIASANASRATSEREDSTETEQRLPAQLLVHPIQPRAEATDWAPRTPNGHPDEMFEFGHNIPSQGAVRFEDPMTSAQAPTDRIPSPALPESIYPEAANDASAIITSSLLPSPINPLPTVTSSARAHRAASLRTIDSTASSTSSRSSREQTEYHPVIAAAQPISTRSTPANSSPIMSGPPSINEGGRLTNGHADQELPSTSNTPQSRRSSLLRDPRSGGGSNNASSGDLSEVRPGRTSRLGSASTIVIQHDATQSQGRPTAQRSSSGTSSSNVQPEDGRGRGASKFSSLSAALRGLSQDVKYRVKKRSASGTPAALAESSSSVTSFRQPVAQGGPSSRVVRPVGTDFTPHGRGGAGRRSRSTEKRTASPAPRDGSRSESRGRGRNKGMKALTGAFGINEEIDDDVHNWKEFRKGTYNYPISFPIPVNAPPTIHAEFGTVIYRLKATVHRVGALTPNLVEDMEITMIACPQEDDMEETDNVIVERQWEEQMRYQIALSGKAFPIGGTIPMSIRLMPLMKCKIYRLTVALEEKTDYYAAGRKVARHETPRRFVLLAAKNADNKKDRADPLLPIISDLPSAARDSPLAELAKTAALNNPREFGEFSNPEDDVYASLLDPLGPWHLEKDLVVPDCASRIKFTSKHEQTNISIGHWLKVTIRVERGDDVAVDSKGRRKQFDIIIETPIKVLDCRVNTQWNSLPTYALVGGDQQVSVQFCSVHSRAGTVISNPRPSQALTSTPPTSVRGLAPSSFVPISRDSSLPGAERRSDSQPPEHEDTLLERNLVYDRLMSGQETESGEEPPSYGEAVANAIRSARSASRSASRSLSRAGRILEERDASTSRSRSRLRE